MVAAAGAGPTPIPHRELTVDALVEGIRYCLSEQAGTAASTLAAKMQSEAGVTAAVASFHRNLPLERLQCDLVPDLPAVWSFSKNRRKLKLSKVAAEILVANGSIDAKRLTMYVKELMPCKDSLSSCCSAANEAILIGMPSAQYALKIADGIPSLAERLPS